MTRGLSYSRRYYKKQIKELKKPLIAGSLLLSLYRPWILVCFIALVAGFFLYQGYIKSMDRKKLLLSGIEEIDRMEGTKFEEYLAVHFPKLGFKAKLTPRNDYGADVIITHPNGTKIVVQAKRYSHPVGLKAVQEAVGSVAFYNCNKALVVTNNYFTKPAITLAKANGVELWNRDQLIESICLAKETK